MPVSQEEVLCLGVKVNCGARPGVRHCNPRYRGIERESKFKASLGCYFTDSLVNFMRPGLKRKSTRRT